MRFTKKYAQSNNLAAFPLEKLGKKSKSKVSRGEKTKDQNGDNEIETEELKELVKLKFASLKKIFQLE